MKNKMDCEEYLNSLH